MGEAKNIYFTCLNIYFFDYVYSVNQKPK